MGFFDFMTKMAAGRPIFDDSGARDVVSEQSQSPEPRPKSEPVYDKANDHTFPVVEIRRVTSHLSGNQMQIYCMLSNNWKEELMLDKIYLLDTKRELGTVLRSGEARDFLVYSGPVLTHEYHEAQLDYKTQREGDYFAAMYDVSFVYHGDSKTYTLDDMKLRLPIRDIYG